MGIDVGGNSHDGIYPKRSKRGSGERIYFICSICQFILQFIFAIIYIKKFSIPAIYIKKFSILIK